MHRIHNPTFLALQALHVRTVPVFSIKVTAVSCLLTSEHKPKAFSKRCYRLWLATNGQLCAAWLQAADRGALPMVPAHLRCATKEHHARRCGAPTSAASEALNLLSAVFENESMDLAVTGRLACVSTHRLQLTSGPL